MFARFCGGTLKTKFFNPFIEALNISVLFDPVYWFFLFKCIRNNWFNQKENRQTFVFESYGGKQFGCVSDLKLLYMNEEN